MRKSTSLKLGLNLRKPKTSTSEETKHLAGNRQIQRQSVFSDTNDDNLEEDDYDEETATKQPQFTGGTQTRESVKLAKELEESDPSVYAYDDVYDSINAARSKINARRKDKDNSKPKYMEKLLETAKRRQEQQVVVKERILEKERQREGEMYADKETFVTTAYKELKDQRQQLAQEEEKRQEEEDSARAAAGNSKTKQLFGASAGFYRDFLDRVDREDVGKVAASLDASGQEDDDSSDMPKDQQLVIGKTDSLRVGLNVNSNVDASRAARTVVSDDRQQNRPVVQKQAIRGFRRHDRDIGLEEHERSKAEAGTREREERIRKYARRNDQAAIEAARQRYFARMELKTAHSVVH
ncbi:hypothetical protein EV175_000109 [Coemansia sp. RSA 1933]|nr:hypothetical protein EV175_000109 [Coemansia sp. RSA 1933]